MEIESSIIGNEDMEEYNEQLPGSRGFGISPDVLDSSPGEALNRFAMSLQEKVEQFIPDIEILDVSGQVNTIEDSPDNSSLSAKISIGRRNEE